MVSQCFIDYRNAARQSINQIFRQKNKDKNMFRCLTLYLYKYIYYLSVNKHTQNAGIFTLKVTLLHCWYTAGLLALLRLNVTKLVLFSMWASALLLWPFPDISAPPLSSVPHLLLPPCDPVIVLPSLDGPSSPSHPAFAMSKTPPLSLLPLVSLFLYSSSGED